MKYHCLHRRFTYRMMGRRLARDAFLRSLVKGSFRNFAISVSSDKRCPLLRQREPVFRDIGQVGSLAGAAYLLYNNAGVLSRAQCEQKSHVEHKGKSSVDLDSQYEFKP